MREISVFVKLGSIPNCLSTWVVICKFKMWGNFNSSLLFVEPSLNLRNSEGFVFSIFNFSQLFTRTVTLYFFDHALTPENTHLLKSISLLLQLPIPRDKTPIYCVTILRCTFPLCLNITEILYNQ